MADIIKYTPCILFRSATLIKKWTHFVGLVDSRVHLHLLFDKRPQMWPVNNKRQAQYLLARSFQLEFTFS